MSSSLTSDANWKLIAPLILHKKRYIFLASFILSLHIFGAIFVIKHLAYDTWTSSLRSWRLFVSGTLKFDLETPDHDHDEKQILIVWMLAIQTRYVVSDSYAVFQAVKNRRLLWATVSTHLLEGAICSIFFLGHNSKDCFVFGLACVVWTALWVGAYVAMDYDRLNRLQEKILKKVKNSSKKVVKGVISFENLRQKLGGSLSPYRGWGVGDQGSPVGNTTEEEEEGTAGEEDDHEVQKGTRRRYGRGRSRTRK
ncbi:hypothetical protein TrVE_jg9860 [Triparma verrucosa]|uniref:Uncharacterized protein n=1 Tax=Triparma verrucosa TaxID=1606542 RepID=A0A9W7FGZ8_9STRA|nr:hypothetical protein TrVE_jg9860 [Triparma verrucosa]